MPPEDILIRFSVRDDGTPVIERVNSKFKDTKKNVEGLLPGFEKAGRGVGDFISQNAALIGTVTAVGLALKASYDAFQGYAQQVRDIASISGAGAEETSRLLQVLDDFQLGAEDVTTATRVMTKNGLTPTIETLAKLSDQYLAIQDPMQRNQFIIDNLGRSGLQWVNVLKQGGDALKRMGDEVNKNLILSDEQIRKAEEQRLAMDALADAWQGFKVQLGSAVGEIILANKHEAEMQAQLEELLGMNFDTISRAAAANREFGDSVFAIRKQIERGQAATDYWTKWLETSGEVIQSDTIPNMEDLQKTYENWLDLLNSVSDEYVRHNQEMASISEERTKVESEMQAALAAGWWENSEKVMGYKDKLAELSDKEAEYTEQYQKNVNSRILAGLAENLAKGGWTEAELQYYEQIGLQMGIFTEDSIAQARKVREEIQRLTDEFNNIPEKKYVDIVVSTSVSRSDILRERDVASTKGYATGTGGWLTVPPGYPNDSYPVMLSSGEKFAVVPSGNSAGYSVPSSSSDGMSNIIPILKQFADEIARANRAAFEKATRK